MTNREWLESLTDDELVEWMLLGEFFDPQKLKMADPTPKLYTIVRRGINAKYSLKEWLKEERKFEKSY